MALYHVRICLRACSANSGRPVIKAFLGAYPILSLFFSYFFSFLSIVFCQATLSPDAIHLACGMTVLTLFLGRVFTVIEAIVVVLRHHTPSASDTHSLPEFGVSGWLTERL